MTVSTLEEAIKAVRGLPREDLSRLRQWIEEQEQQGSEKESRAEVVLRNADDYRLSKEWIEANRTEYLNQWVVLDGDILVSYGMDGSEVYDRAKAAGVETPFLVQIVDEKEPFFMGWK
jgi:Family of unknown function (DUF5678)